MLTKIIKQIFIFTFLPQGFFFYCFYFNDFLNYDLFNLKQVEDLSTKITEVKDLVKAQNEISNNKLDDIKNVSYSSYNTETFILVVIVLFTFCYFGFNYFGSDPSAGANMFSEQVAKQNAGLAENINSNMSDALKNQNNFLRDQNSCILNTYRRTFTAAANQYFITDRKVSLMNKKLNLIFDYLNIDRPSDDSHS